MQLIHIYSVVNIVRKAKCKAWRRLSELFLFLHKHATNKRQTAHVTLGATHFNTMCPPLQLGLRAKTGNARHNNKTLFSAASESQTF